jgi:hypothetical protein
VFESDEPQQPEERKVGFVGVMPGQMQSYSQQRQAAPADQQLHPPPAQQHQPYFVPMQNPNALPKVESNLETETALQKFLRINNTTEDDPNFQNAIQLFTANEHNKPRGRHMMRVGTWCILFPIYILRMVLRTRINRNR